MSVDNRNNGYYSVDRGNAQICEEVDTVTMQPIPVGATCESCAVDGRTVPATTRSINPEYSGYVLCEECAAEYDSRIPAQARDIRATLHTLADESGQHTVGRYIEIAWSEGLLVSGCIAAADGVVLSPNGTEYIDDETPAQLVPYIPTGGETQPVGVHPNGPRYVPVLVIADTDGNAQAMVWTAAGRS